MAANAFSEKNRRYSGSHKGGFGSHRGFWLLAAAVLLFPGAATAQQEDPYAPVYLVSSRETFDTSLRPLARDANQRRGAFGTPVVISRARAHQLPDIARRVHEREHRCGGYFAFDTRDEAEAFLRQDRSVQAVQAQAVMDYTIDQQGLVRDWMAQVSEPAIRGTIQDLSGRWPNRYFASTHGVDAAHWIRDTWLALADGRDDVTAELFTGCFNCGGQPSPVLTITGSEVPDEIVVLGGHMDSISSTGFGDDMVAPGADDDASGIAVLTEALRIAMADGWRPRRTIKFMGYAAEEVGLRGSRALADAHRARGDNVVGVLQLDMTNYSTNGTTLDLRIISDFSNGALQQFVRDLFDTYLAPMGHTRGASACGYACSDHASWTAAGYPAVFVAEPVLFPTRHTPTDVMPTIGSDASVSVPIAQLAVAFLAEMGKTAAPQAVLDPLPAIHDINGDGKSDLLWRNTGTGINTLWLSARSGTRRPVARVQDADWSVAAIGDFDGDGQDDLFWRHDTTGANTLWRSARAAQRLPVPAVPDLAWQVHGAGDFDGDGTDDLLWRNADNGAATLWPGANADAAVTVANASDLAWRITGVGDFDGDGTADLHWQHDDGRTRIWGGGDSATPLPASGAATPLRVLGIGDLDGDGRSDVVLQHGTQRGAVVSWPGGTPDGQAQGAPVNDADTHLLGTGDYDGDGRADLFWRNTRTGLNTIWLGGRAGDRQAMPRVAKASWDVQP